MRTWFKRILLWLGTAVLVAVSTALGIQALLSHLSLRDNPPPGSLIDLNGRQVHVRCAGEGSPTVILQAGHISLTWMSVFSEIAELTRVCTYDRPGWGWSEPASSPRTAETIVQELRVLLQAADIKPPYVLAGHSFGGLLMQLYAVRYPDDFEGIVLVDSSHPDQAQRTSDLQELDTVAKALKIVGPLGLARMLLPVAPAGDPTSRDSTVIALEKDLLMTNRTLRTIVAELSVMRQSLLQVADSSVDFGDKPLVVLTQGRRRPEFWQQMQEDLSRLSRVSDWQVVDDAGHFIHHDRPDVVVDAIRRMLEQIEANPSGASR